MYHLQKIKYRYIEAFITSLQLTTINLSRRATYEAKFLKNRRNRLWRRYATSKSHSD